MSTILVTVSKRAIEDTMNRAHEAADRGPAGGIIDGPRRISEVQRFLAKPKANRQARRRRAKILHKLS